MARYHNCPGGPFRKLCYSIELCYEKSQNPDFISDTKRIQWREGSWEHVIVGVYTCKMVPENDICSGCEQKIKVGDVLCILPVCFHELHLGCFERYYDKESHSCPQCGVGFKSGDAFEWKSSYIS
jgi:hypothetical protein